MNHNSNYFYPSVDSTQQSSVGQASTSPFVLVDNMDCSPPEIFTSPSETTTALSVNNPNRYVSRIQSNRLYDDDSIVDAHEINRLLSSDLQCRIVQVSESIAGCIFPDTDFSFPINNQFLMNFRGSFLSEGCTINPSNFANESATSTFLNQMVSTISQFLRATKQTSLEPLRYFSALNATQPVDGHPVKRMPDITLLRLIDGCTRDGRVKWRDIHAMVEHTREKKPPKRMTETVTTKSFLTFCSQPDRDFVPFLCITGEGFHIVLSDHVGHIETDVIPFSRSTGALIFLRMVMGLAFLSDNSIGLDETMTRRECGRSGGKRFCDQFPPFECKVNNPYVQLFASLSDSAIVDSPPGTSTTLNDPATDTTTTQDSNEYVTNISIGSTKYPVIRLLFRTQSLIGRATRAFLVQLPDGRRGVLKDSWITTSRRSEADILRGLRIPFGPQLIDSCILRDTERFRSAAATIPLINECREKRRIVTYPAGVHISDFSSLWELMVVMLDMIIAIMYLAAQQSIHRDISYTNILIREVDDDQSKEASLEARKRVMNLLGLSEIESLRNELKCREGLLIDFDYGAVLSVIESKLALVGSEDKLDELEMNVTEVQLGKGKEKQGDRGKGDGVNAASSGWTDAQDPTFPIPKASGARTGTAPFISIELLIYAVEHRVAHDLESLFYVLLFISTHLQGPSGQYANPPLYGHPEAYRHPSVLRHWISMNDFSNLGHLKFSHMIGHFESHVLLHISPYFRPLRQHLIAFWTALLPQRLAGSISGRSAVESTATCQDIIQVIKAALLDQALIQEARKATGESALRKRSRPGELVTAENGWDVVKVPKTMKSKAKITSKVPRQTKLMGKTSRSQGSRF